VPKKGQLSLRTQPGWDLGRSDWTLGWGR